jgi:hypothetical protein
LKTTSTRLTHCRSSSGAVRDLDLEVPQLLKYLKQYGPDLVAQFRVDEEFMNQKNPRWRAIAYPIHSSHKIISGNEMGWHAMVLVEMRRVESEKNWRLLLQNWWSEMQLGLKCHPKPLPAAVRK